MNQPLLKAVRTEADLPEASGTLVEASAGLGASLQYLRKARRLSLAEVSTRLKFSTRQLDALEHERWHELPQGLPLRGLVKNYARYLETDPEPLMHMLEAQAGEAARKPATPPSAPTVGPVDMPLETESRQWSWAWLLVILAVLLVGAFYGIERGLIPDSWPLVDWLKSITQ